MRARARRSDEAVGQAAARGELQAQRGALRRLVANEPDWPYQLLLCRLQVQDYGFDDCCSPRVPMSDPGELPGLHAASLCKQLQ